jgi:flavin reductase (DIM6/NTAB) family NADH-FMN oxidoreductase RutF
VTGDELRHAIGHFATGVTVVTSHDPESGPVGTTASAVSSLSIDPALLLVCLGRASATLRAIRAHGRFAVNVLAAEQRELSARFARPGGLASWDGVAVEAGTSGVPRLAGALATLECTLEQLLAGGDHEIVVGLVRDALVSDGYAEPLLHWRGDYARLGAV